METLEQILRNHARKYPLMEPQDAVKLIYQNVFGGGHLIRDPAACRCALRHEYEETPQDSYAPVLEMIGNGMARVMLNAREHTGSMNGFLLKLDILRKVTASGVFGFSSEDLEKYLDAYQQAGYPMVSHSEQYSQAYKPAYRIVQLRILPEELTLGFRHHHIT